MTRRPTSRRRRLRDRRIALLAAVALAAAGAIAVLLLQRDDDRSATRVTTSTLVSTSTLASTTTTAPPTTAVTTAPPTSSAPPSSAPSTTVALPALGSDPQSYAQYLFAAWRNADRANAARAASNEAVDQIFMQVYQPVGSTNPWQFQACNPAAGSVYCSWSTSSGSSLVMQVRNTTGGLPVLVIGVTRT